MSRTGFPVAEFGNVLWKKVQAQTLDQPLAEAVLVSVRATLSNTATTAELIDDAFAIAMTYKRTVYDSLYLALMQRENCPFVTADERLFNAVSSALPNVRLLRDFTL